MTLVENLANSTIASPTDIDSYEGGLRVQNKYKGDLYGSARFEITYYQGLSHDYGNIRFERTLEDAIYSKAMWQDRFRNEWFAGYNFSKAIQDIERANYNDELSNHKQTNYSLYYGWKREFSKSLSFSIYSGFTTCLYNESNQRAMLPMGGMNLSYVLPNMTFSLETFQKIEGSGETSGIYGSQTRKEAKVSGAWRVAKNLSIFSYCLFSRAVANFQNENLPQESPILTASVGAEYKLSKNVSAKAIFSQRSYVGHSAENQLPEGPSGSFAVNYVAF